LVDDKIAEVICLLELVLSSAQKNQPGVKHRQKTWPSPKTICFYCMRKHLFLLWEETAVLARMKTSVPETYVPETTV